MGAAVGDRELWSSRRGFLLASIGFAVGLGNIWRFPFIVGENGGGAFLLIYFACAFLISFPLLCSELGIGRMGRASPSKSYVNVARRAAASKRWGWLGTLATVCVFIILSYYTVVTGWTLEYFTRAAMGSFEGLDGLASASAFGELLGNPARLIFWNTMVYLLIAIVVRRGVQKGIEKAASILMPAMFAALFMMLIYGAVKGNFAQAVAFLLKPDFSEVGFGTVMAALGQAFFSICIGMAGLITFGSYLPDSVRIPRSGVVIILADTLIALLAGFMIFPLVFAFGIEPSAGPGLLFQSLPLAFGQMQGGQIFGSIFFLLLLVAALSSCIGAAEACASWVEERWKVPRRKCVTWLCAAGWLAGLLSIMSLGDWSWFHPLGFIPAFEGKNIFDTFDFLAANVLLLVGGIGTAVFFGWQVPKAINMEAFGISQGPLFAFLKFMLRYVIPVVLVAAVVMGLSEKAS